MPASAKKLRSSTFELPSGANAHFIWLDPVDYVIPRGELTERPKQYLERTRREFEAQVGQPGIEVANGWIGKASEEFTVKDRTYRMYQFCSDAGYLQATLRWPTGNQQAEQDARLLLACCLWSAKRTG